MYSEWNEQSKERFKALLEEIWASASEPGHSLSQEKFGKLFDVRGSTVQDWLQGSIPRTPRLEKIASRLSWTLDDLLYYLKTGNRPNGNTELEKLLYNIDRLPLQHVALLMEAGAKRIASEVKNLTKLQQA